MNMVEADARDRVEIEREENLDFYANARCTDEYINEKIKHYIFLEQANAARAIGGGFEIIAGCAELVVECDQMLIQLGKNKAASTQNLVSFLRNWTESYKVKLCREQHRVLNAVKTYVLTPFETPNDSTKKTAALVESRALRNATRLTAMGFTVIATCSTAYNHLVEVSTRIITQTVKSKQPAVVKGILSRLTTLGEKLQAEQCRLISIALAHERNHCRMGGSLSKDQLSSIWTTLMESTENAFLEEASKQRHKND